MPQTWSPSVNSRTYTCNNGVITPTIVPIYFEIYDYNYGLNFVYSDYRLVKQSDYLNPSVNWISIDSFPDFIVSYSWGMSYSYTPVFQFLSLLVNGNYTFRQNFIIQGLDAYGEWHDVDDYFFDIILDVTGVVSNPTPTFYPDTIAFNHQQNQTLPSLLVVMNGDNWKIIGKLNFVLSSPTVGVTITVVGSGPSLYQTISGSGSAFIFITLSSFYDGQSVFSESDLEGTFEIQNSNAYFGDVTWTVNVLRLADFLTIPYPSEQKAFTLDTKYFEFQSEATNTYFQFDALIKTYDFFTNTLNEITVNQKIVLFKGVQKIMLGQLIHRLMRKFIEPNANEFQYKEATLKITCSEKLLSDNSTVRSGISNEIPFIAGLSKGVTNLGFLDFNPLPNRVTKNSFAYINFIVPLGSFEIRILKNGTQTGTLMSLSDNTGMVLSKKVTFSNYNQGDIIQFVLDRVGETNSNAPKKTFKLFPEGNFSNHIVWENEFLVQSALECTGTASIKSDFEFISQKVLQNLVEILEHLSSSKEVKLFINTGWLLKTDVDSIESLIRSKRAWLIKESGNIALRPIAKSMVNQDLERELIEFSLEFIINQNYNEETYSL